MTNYKLFAFCFFLSLISCAVAAQTSAKTFGKSFNVENIETLVFDLPGAIDLKVWNNPTVKIEMSVSLPSANPAMLNELANIGRYNMVSRTEGDKWFVSIPTMQKQIKLKGEILKEVLSFVVFVPKDLKVEMLNNQLAEVKK
jgi:hypothetical protein